MKTHHLHYDYLSFKLCIINIIKYITPNTAHNKNMTNIATENISINLSTNMILFLKTFTIPFPNCLIIPAPPIAPIPAAHKACYIG